ncbi:hypothetical protein AB833_03245 [Chromatiales bacterium (ex Bugula neritina AB1)]|nr:hypothetical protein AB833_03245 [Chromatiales bacterium (ex Bugula neritina AB1)]
MGYRGEFHDFVNIVWVALAIALIVCWELPLPYRLLVIVGGIYVIVLHRANIQRLLVGTEPHLGGIR